MLWKVFWKLLFGKISESASSVSDFIKSKYYWDLLKSNSLKIKEKTSEHGSESKERIQNSIKN